MEVKLLYPQLIGYSLVLAFMMLLFWRRRNKHKKGVIVANSRYIKKKAYYKFLSAKYHLINLLIKIVCILLILASAILTARIYKTERHEEKKENRDIMLCMDVSGSVYNLDEEILGTFIDIVSHLKDERFGISVFDSSPVTILPLTTDYDYAINVLENLKAGFRKTNVQREDRFGNISTISRVMNYSSIRDMFAGAYSGSGSSLIGDGLAYCGSTFKQNDGRTKIVVFTTDNELAGSPLITLDDAAGYCKKMDVKVYPIGTKSINGSKRSGLVNAANVTGGKYYDYSSFSTNEIVKDIEQLNKTSIISNVYVTNQDLPERVFIYLIYLIPLLYVLSWRVRI